MRVSFTGTRQGMSQHQLNVLESWLREHLGEVSVFAHGACVGADLEAHRLVHEVCGLSTYVAVYPSTAKTRVPDSTLVATGHVNFLARPAPPLQRNGRIVDVGSDLLIAAPLTDVDQLRSGTWAAVRYARKVGTRVLLLKRNIG